MTAGRIEKRTAWRPLGKDISLVSTRPRSAENISPARLIRYDKRDRKLAKPAWKALRETPMLAVKHCQTRLRSSCLAEVDSPSASGGSLLQFYHYENRTSPTLRNQRCCRSASSPESVVLLGRRAGIEASTTTTSLSSAIPPGSCDCAMP